MGLPWPLILYSCCSFNLAIAPVIHFSLASFLATFIFNFTLSFAIFKQRYFIITYFSAYLFFAAMNLFTIYFIAHSFYWDSIIFLCWICLSFILFFADFISIHLFFSIYFCWMIFFFRLMNFDWSKCQLFSTTESLSPFGSDQLLDTNFTAGLPPQEASTALTWGSLQ